MEKTKSQLINGGQLRLAIIGFPYDENSSFRRGAAGAPPLIREALFSDSSNLWTETGIDLGEDGVLFDAGDIEFAAAGDAFGDIEMAVSNLMGRHLCLISLGGDHSITYPIVRGFRNHFQRLSILHFDAHSDLYDEYQGNRFSHACPFARIMEENLAERLVQVGIRSINGHQRAQAEKFGVEVIEMKQLRHDMVFEFDSPLYISFDMDALDPAFAPGVSHREAGGLSTRQVIEIIQGLKTPVVGADIVEFNPTLDPLNVTSTVCAKILKEIAAKMLSPD